MQGERRIKLLQRLRKIFKHYTLGMSVKRRYHVGTVVPIVQYGGETRSMGVLEKLMNEIET